MFPEMRRSKQMLSQEDCIKILEKGKTGILGVSTNRNPSITPLNYVYEDYKIFFHCALSGYKLKAMDDNPDVTFCVVGKDCVKPEEYSTNYESVIAYGKARLLMMEDEKRIALRKLIHKYCGVEEKEAEAVIDKGIERTGVVCIELAHITGKFHL